MKKIYILALTLIISQMSFSQSPVLSFMTKGDSVDITNKWDTIYGDGAAFVVKKEYLAVMTGMDSILVGCKRVELQIIPGTFEYYCWKECYIPKEAGTLPVWYADDSLMMVKDEFVINYSTYFQGKGNMGSASYRYIFTPKGFPNDSVYIDIYYEILTVGINEEVLKYVEVFPNPASDVININYSKENANTVNARIFNSSGQVMKTFVLDGSDNIDVSDLSPGLFFLELLEDNKSIYREKLIIE